MDHDSCMDVFFIALFSLLFFFCSVQTAIFCSRRPHRCFLGQRCRLSLFIRLWLSQNWRTPQQRHFWGVLAVGKTVLVCLFVEHCKSGGLYWSSRLTSGRPRRLSPRLSPFFPRTLDLTRCVELSDNGIVPLLSGAARLSELSLHSLDRITRAAIEAVNAHLHKLKVSGRSRNAADAYRSE